MAAWLTEENHDAVHLREYGMERSMDEEVFERARIENRILLTFDLDFSDIAAHFQSDMPCIVLFRLRNPVTPFVITRLRGIINDIPDVLTSPAVVIVEDARYRIRRPVE